MSERTPEPEPQTEPPPPVPHLPVHGYRDQTDSNIALVNDHKIAEERLLRTLDTLAADPDHDARWLAIARTHFEQGFMALNRAILQPQRIDIDK